jgi:hypothetical protein
MAMEFYWLFVIPKEALNHEFFYDAGKGENQTFITSLS